ncbi:unnamed protein product [Musa acuminata subsp. malaccensis]|uniref:(wild Malaysian banana) hypothetical protein n=1 Tax=Musa acuminata subsp. malaccensis TaxID=214687 RepID=A0A804I6H6_MUSAM|nr:unnamed protein product [Musa acuminata subsp. malaccensis]
MEDPSDTCNPFLCLHVTPMWRHTFPCVLVCGLDTSVAVACRFSSPLNSISEAFLQQIDEIYVDQKSSHFRRPKVPTSLSLSLSLSLSTVLLLTFCCRSSQLITEAEIKPTTDVCYSDDEELPASIFGREKGLFFCYNESIFNDTLLGEEEQDSTDQEHLSKVDESLVTELPHSSPLEDQSNPGLENDDSPVSDVIRTSSSPTPIICGSVEDEDCVGDAFHNNEKEEEEEQNEESSKKQKLLIVAQTHPGSKKFQLEEHTSGGSLTSESTSKSSMEWRSSTNIRDSETECPFSSSSRRSSSNWEKYTWFRKYDEDMTFFDRISAQKLTETESFRSMKYQPKSVSRRIVHKFTTHKKKGNRDPYQELESAYVAQICLAWEALNWNYNHFLQWSAKGSNSERASCTAWMAQQFQQFQVLLQRFIENEPYERGRRPQVFARTRISSPKLLLVPEFRDSKADEGKEEMISSTEFSAILEDAIRTFMNFLKADKENPCQILKAFIKRKSSSVDPNLRRLLKRANKKKKMRLKDLLKSRRCLKKNRLKGEEEMEILMGLIDMKIVSRTLRMHEISHEQLHWCEEKMTKVRVCDGKIQRDSSPLFFPVQ